MDVIFKRAGIRRRLTTTYTPQQNGVAERKNRTLIEAARCLLIQSGLPPSFWAEAISTANYVKNRCISRSTDGSTPYELWNGRLPVVKHLKTFGERVFFLNKSPNKSKFEARGIEGLVVGYSTISKAYRVWVQVNERLWSHETSD